MSVCAAPPRRKIKQRTTKTTILTPPVKRYEFCSGSSSIVIPPEGGTTVITVCCPQPGPAGPVGPAGPAGTDGGAGLKYVGTWTSGAQYYFESGSPTSTSVVQYDDVMYVCTASHTADGSTKPGEGVGWETSWAVFGNINRFRWKGDWVDDFLYHKNDVVRNSINGSLYICKLLETSSSNTEPGYGVTWESSWDLLSTDGTSGLGTGSDWDFFTGLRDSVFDWIANATVGDWLNALAIGTGIVVAGQVITDMFTDDGTGDGQADSRYNGSAGYDGTIAAPSLPIVVSSLMEFGGFTSGMIDVSLLPSTPVNFTIDGNINIRTVLNQLALAYQFDIVSSGAIIKFIPKYQDPVRSLTIDDLGHIKSDGTTGGVKYAAKRMQGIDLPRSVSLKYYSAAIDHNPFVQTSTLETYTDGQDSVIEVPFTLTDLQAKTITETVLVNAHIEQQQYTFSTDYYNVDLEPADVITIPLDSGGSTQVRIIEVNETDDGLLEFTATRSDYNSYSYVASSQAAVTPPTQPTQFVTSIGYSQTLFLEVPPLNDNDAAAPRLKALVHGYGAQGWPGADVYRSVDGGNSYSLLASNSALSTFGIVTSPIAAPSQYQVWDTTTQIIVQMKQGTLISKSDISVQNGENWCMIGQEVIGFANATLVGPDTYSLSRLLRGRAGSELNCSTHVANELFVVLDSTLVDIPIAVADLGKTVKCKTVTVGSDISKVTAVDIKPYGLNLRPWAPAHLTAVRQPNSDWIITWKERPRVNNSLRDYTEIVHDADWGGFGWAIMSGSTIKRTGTTVNQTFTYTAAQQVADFGSAQGSLDISVAQMSTIVGGGYPATL